MNTLNMEEMRKSNKSIKSSSFKVQEINFTDNFFQTDTGRIIMEQYPRGNVVKKKKNNRDDADGILSGTDENEKFSSELENNLGFVKSINAITREISLNANTLYKAIHDMPMSRELYDKFLSGKMSYVNVANKLIATRESMGVKYSKYASKERLNKNKPISKGEWINLQDKKDKRIFM